jgi:UDP-2-acetamido-3-amino-2,3-dideoxy-glucuronate N-acetyltransferase
LKEYVAIADDVKMGGNVKISRFVNLYGCSIGDNCKLGTFIEIQKDAFIGKNCKISSHTFVCSGVHIDDNCFIGHGVMFINDKVPRSVNLQSELETELDWSGRYVETFVESDVSIGSNATILGGVRIGAGALVGAGSVVTKNIPANQVWAGNPAKYIRERE